MKWLQRPSNRPFAGITTHDPDGNVFDISQKDMKNRTSARAGDDFYQGRQIAWSSAPMQAVVTPATRARLRRS